MTKSNDQRIHSTDKVDGDSTSDVSTYPVRPIVLAGGVGKRLWPLSRTHSPKQLIVTHDGTSLLSHTISRARMLSPGEPIIIQTSKELAPEIKSHLILELGSLDQIEIRAEPKMANTCFAFAWAAAQAIHEDPSTTLILLPSDHLIQNTTAFIEALQGAVVAAQTGDLVLLGTKPQEASEHLGYMRLKESENHGATQEIKAVRDFIEKPTLDEARQLLIEGALCNLGILVATPQAILTACYRATKTSRQNADLAQRAASGQEIDLQQVAQVSFDHAVLEHVDNAKVINVDCGWSDLGSFASFEKVIQPDESDNRIQGNIVQLDLTNSTVFSNGHRVVALGGLKDMLIVDVSDALLVMKKDASFDVRQLVDLVGANSPRATRSPETQKRPWGYWKTLSVGEGFWVKLLNVAPGKRLSLQSHLHRSESWTVISGQALIEFDHEQMKLNVGESRHVAPGQKHRLCNANRDQELKIIEIASGTLLDESDIIRYEDDWNREAHDN